MALVRTPLFRSALVVAGLIAGFAFPAAAQPARDAAQKNARANALVQAGKPEAAIPIYKELVATFPSEPSIGVNLAIAQFKAGLYRDSNQECRRLLRLKPDLFPALLFLGASHLKLGEASEAIQPLRHALSINPGDPNARLMLGDALFAQQLPKEAAGHYAQAARAMPESARAWFGAYRCYEAWALELLASLEKAAPGSPEFLALSGDYEKDRQQFARALRSYRQAQAIQPAFRGLPTKAAEVYELAGHPDWALTERKREHAAACDSPTPECDFVAGRLEEAAGAASTTPAGLYWQALAVRELARRARTRLDELPPSPERYEAAAELHERCARYRDAATAWREALALTSGDDTIQRRLALALCHANDCVSALPLLTGLLAKSPSSAELNYLAGLALNTTRDPGQALPYLEKAVRLDDSFLPAHATLGEALLEAGSPERAIPHLERAVADDESGIRRYQLARALQSTGKRDRALAVLREYREILNRRATTRQEDSSITPP
jgi:tetratricopeptide (TPR) repeat protein